MGVVSLRKNALLNSIKTIFSVLFPLITYPYILRILGVENIGKVNFGNSIVSYFVIVASLGINSYGTRGVAGLRENEKKCKEFIDELYTLNLLTTLFAYALLFAFVCLGNQVNKYKILILVQSLVLLLNHVGVEWIYTAFEKYFYITIRTIASQIVALTLMFLFVKEKEDYILYALIIVLSNGFASVANFLCLKKKERPHLYFSKNVKTHITPMILLCCNLLAITVYVNADITMLGLIKDEHSVGIYSLSVKVYLIVKQVITSIIAVSMPRLSYAYNNNGNKGLKSLGSKILKSILFITVPVSLGVFLLSPEIVMVVGGERYLKSIMPLRILSIALFFASVGGFFSSSILLAIGKEKNILIATFASAGFNILANLFLIPLWAENGAALTTVLSEAIVMIMCVYYAKREISIGIEKKTVFELFLSIGWIFFVCFCSKYLIESYFIRCIVSFLSGAIGYAFILLLCKEELLRLK